MTTTLSQRTSDGESIIEFPYCLIDEDNDIPAYSGSKRIIKIRKRLQMLGAEEIKFRIENQRRILKLNGSHFDHT